MKSDRRPDRRALLALPMQLWTIAFIGLALLYIVGLSLLGRGEALTVTDEITLDNYARLLDEKYLRVMGLSLRLAGLTTLISLLLGYPFAYFMARLSPRARTILMVLVIAPFWTNALIRIYGWKILLYANGPINQALLALGLIQKPLKLLYSQGAVLVGMVYAMIPFVILPVYTGIERMDWSAVEAARDLGATPLRALLTVTLPLLRPAVFSGALLALAMSLDDFVISFFVSGAGGSTLPLKIYSSARYGVSAQINALCTVMLAAVFLLVGLSQWALRKKR